MARTGRDLAERITAVVGDLELDNRSTRLRRRSTQEARLARLLIAAAWYEIGYRNPFGGFARTPIGQQTDPRFTLRGLLNLVPTEAVDDVTALVTAAGRGPARQLRANTTAAAAASAATPCPLPDPAASGATAHHHAASEPEPRAAANHYAPAAARSSCCPSPEPSAARTSPEHRRRERTVIVAADRYGSNGVIVNSRGCGGSNISDDSANH